MVLTMAQVWIEDGCIQCGWCQNLEPRVFLVSERGCEIVADARIDGRTDDNRLLHAALRADALDDEAVNYLAFVAGGCPTEVIHLAGIAAADDPLGATLG